MAGGVYYHKTWLNGLAFPKTRQEFEGFVVLKHRKK